MVKWLSVQVKKPHVIKETSLESSYVANECGAQDVCIFRPHSNGPHILLKNY